MPDVTRQPIDLGEWEAIHVQAVARHRNLEESLYPRRIGPLRQLFQNAYRRRYRRLVGD
ncbi:hypothetical protein D3C80_1522360 [compost metagenome]